MSSSPCSRLVRGRVKGLASCFYACRFPIDEEPSDQTICSKLPQIHKTSMATNPKFSSRTHDSRERIPVVNKIFKEGEEVESSAQSSSTKNSANDKVVDEGSRDSKWPQFSEEDYIVFCFREDGAIHMINENKPPKAYDDTDKKSKEEWSNEMESDWPEDEEIKEIHDYSIIGSKSCGEDSFESCNSNRSDTSTNSFAFPKLGMEWIGSPVHMPKSEKHKATSVLLHCCRF